MCGLTGFWSGQPVGDRAAIVGRMAGMLHHRGPDDSGVWVDDAIGIALAHRRLSILDLSSAGHQPMLSACGRHVLAFNGEIYNHLELRIRLEQGGASPAWRGHSDTETLLACFAAWGIAETLQAAVGMFAIALWDRQQKVLTLARDRIGEKPLYYGWQGAALLFGSELKALRAHPAFLREVDRDALTLFLRHNYIPSPHSIYRGIAKLPPGHFLRVTAQDREAGSLRPEPYWRYNDIVTAGLGDPFAGSETEAVDALEQQLMRSIGGQMLADVPLGAFLSGGIDSSTVVALMQAQSRQPVRTFTIGFDEADYNEATHAAAVARHLGTQHTELYVRPEDALAVIPELPSIYCEPFGDSSQIPTFLVSRLARQQVTVALSGDAGDELFGGYNRYLLACRLWRRLGLLPMPARRAAVAALHALPPVFWNGILGVARPVLPRRFRVGAAADKVRKLADILALPDGEAVYRRLVSHDLDPAHVVIGGAEPPTLLTQRNAWPRTDAFEHWMMALDAQTYLPDDILVKVDRAAMANSLETRVPLLDHRIVEFAWRLPLSLKIRDGQGKWILRQVLYRHVPKELVDRPKMGFGVPIDAWLRGPLREWAEALLDESRLKREGYFQPAPIRQKWREHLSGSHNWQYWLWNVLMFQAWLEADS